MNYIFRDTANNKLNDNWLGELPHNLGNMWQAYFDSHKKRKTK